ncbi:MAG: hypothetical protein MJ062_05640 [Oscillospiraceae bacterium]|nr:hypothetical protein [Oscillospiraceae bacterium]
MELNPEEIVVGYEFDLDDKHRELLGKELTFDELRELPRGTIVMYLEDCADDADGTLCGDDAYGTVCEMLTYEVNTEKHYDCVKLGDGTPVPYTIKREYMQKSPDGYDRIFLMKNNSVESEAHHMIQTELRTPPADVSLAVTEQYTVAYNLNVKIHTSMQAIQQNLYDMCSALKKMRDGKLYKELGYQNFEAYCENEAGISRRHAYRYIAIIEKLPADFVSPGSQIGEHKLYLLTSLTDDQREELTQTVDLESTTVRELREQIAALKEESELDRKERDNANEAAHRWKNTAQSAQADNQRLEDQVQSLTDQVRELESRPVEVAVPEPSHEVQNLQDAMRRMNLEHEQWSAKIQDDHIKQVQEINRQHRAETDALRAEYEERLASAQASPTEAPEPDSKEIFKAYLANAIDAAKRMTAFLAAHPNEACRAQAERFFTAAMKEVLF